MFHVSSIVYLEIDFILESTHTVRYHTILIHGGGGGGGGWGIQWPLPMVDSTFWSRGVAGRSKDSRPFVHPYERPRQVFA